MKFPSFAEECGGVFLSYAPFKFRLLFLDTKILKEIYLKCLVGFFVVAGSELSFSPSCLDQAMTE